METMPSWLVLQLLDPARNRSGMAESVRAQLEKKDRNIFLFE